MQRSSVHKPLLALLVAVILALPLSVAPVSAAPSSPNRLDDEVTQRVQATPESGLIPVIVEGAPAATTLDRAKMAEGRVRNSGGRVVGGSPMLGATVAELTPAQIRALAEDPSVGRIHFDAPVQASATGDTPSSGPTPITFDQTIGASDAWKAGDTGKGVTVAVLDTGIANNDSAFGARVKARVDFVDPANPAQGGYRRGESDVPLAGCRPRRVSRQCSRA
jgi:subtilisin family serine protease